MVYDCLGNNLVLDCRNESSNGVLPGSAPLISRAVSGNGE